MVFSTYKNVGDIFETLRQRLHRTRQMGRLRVNIKLKPKKDGCLLLILSFAWPRSSFFLISSFKSFLSTQNGFSVLATDLAGLPYV